MGCSNSVSTSSSSKNPSRSQTKEYMSLLISAPTEVLVKRNATFKDLLESYTAQQQSKSEIIPFNKIDLTDHADPSNYIITYKGAVQSPDTPLPKIDSFGLSDVVIRYQGKTTDLKFTIQNMSGNVKIPVRCDPSTKMHVLMNLCKEIFAYEVERIEYEFRHNNSILNEDSDLETYNIKNGDVIYVVIKSTRPPEVIDENNSEHDIRGENVDEDEL